MSTLAVVADWRNQAACSASDPDLFFPEPGTPAAQIAEAKRICSACPVQQQCLKDAMARRDTEAICGGLTVEERLRLLQPDGGTARQMRRSPGKASARQLAVQHGAHLLVCLVQWRMTVDQVAAELGSTPSAVYRAFLMLVPARDGVARSKRPTVIEELLRTSKERLKTMDRLGWSHEDMAVVLGTSQSVVSASLAVLKQRDAAIERLVGGGQGPAEALRALQDEEIRVRRESGAGMTVDDVIQVAGKQIRRMHGEGATLRHVALELGICRETVRRAYIQMTSKGQGAKALTQDEMGEAA
jgi:WhiB family redox-sensing transcriptional regulator